MQDYRKSILYRPNLTMPKSYYTDGTFEDSDLNLSLLESATDKQNLIVQLESLIQSLLFVPGAIRPATESILNLVLFLLVLVDDDDINHEDDKEYEIVTPNIAPPIIKPNESNDNVDGPSLNLEEIFKDGHKPNIITKEIATEKVKIERYYSQSTLDISKYYIDRIGEVLGNYHSQLLIYPELEDVLEVVYDAPLLDYKNQVAHSILQSLLKSQQSKITKMRIYQKLYNEKESLTLLKSLEYSKLTLLKLTNKDNVPKNPRLLRKHLQVIEEERHKLNKKMFEYYRYLDSSASALDACLNMHITEAIAKVELNTIKEENI